MTTLPAYALSDDAHPERAAEWEALTARAEQAEAQLAALVEATRALLDGVGSAVVADAEVLRHGDLRASVRAALAAAPATVRAHDERVRTAREIAARLRARAEREEADARVMYKRHAANNVAGWGIVAALHERAASVLRGEADAIAALPVAMQRGSVYRTGPGAERKVHEAESRELSRLGMSHIERAEQAEAALADVRQRCGGYPDSRVDGDGGVVAVVVRERDEARAQTENKERALLAAVETVADFQAKYFEAQAALVALWEAASPCCLAEWPSDAETRSLRCALAATPATLAGHVRARALREAADRADVETMAGSHTRSWLRAIADEAERAK